MIPLSKITSEKNSNRQTKYNRRIPLSQIIGTTSPQEELEKDNGLFDTAGNAFDWWKNNSLAGAGFLGGLASETAGNILQNLGLESAGNLAQNAADEMLDFGAKKVYTADADNFSGSFANQLMSGLTGSFGRLASMIHSDKTADAMIKSSDSLANKTPVSTDNLAEYFTNPRGFISDVGQLGGSMAAIVPFMGLAPEAAVARGVATFGGDAITQALINRGLYNAAKVFAGGAPRAAQYALTSAPVEGAMEGGETRRELLNQGASEEEATKESLITMGKNIPLLLATNALEGLAFFSPLKGTNKALQIAGRAAANSAQEQYEEFAQEGIQNAARGEPYGWLPWNGAPNQYEAAERVRYPALLMGGVGGVAQALGGRNENQENFERGSQENISNEDYSARANLTAKQAEIWDAAQYASARAKEKFGYDILPELIYKQWAHEAGVNFDSENARYNNNFGGLTQTEPNGEENKQPDGNNYYRHFNNVREYADAYVDDFIKYYPEISGAKNEREFASVLKSYGYFGDDLENYVADMEGIQTPANRTSGNQPKIDFASGLQSARKSLDGKQMDNGTVGCVEAVTKILSHVHPEFKKMVDDGVVNTVEGDNSLKSRLEKMGVEIVPFDESNVAQGDIIFYDGEQTYQHVLVADHMDEQGNWRVFGNSSSANKVMEQPLYQGQTPAWIAKVSNLNDTTNAQTQSQEKNSQTEQEESKPLFDINAEDSTTQKLLEKFAKERFSKAVDDEDAEPVNFFNGMFDDKDKFQNTPENRNAIIERYGDEFKTWAANQNQQEQPKKQTQAQKENSFDNGFSLKQAVDQLKAKATQERNAVLLLQLNRAQNNPAELKNILEQNGLKISQPQPQAQPQQDPVTQNTTPENVLPKKLSSTERKIKVASAPVKTGTKGLKSRKKQGAALIDLATQNGIEIPNPEVIALTKGSTKAVQKWRDNLMQAGTFKISAPQTKENSPSLKERAQKILEQNVVNETSTKADKVRAAQADEQARQAQERARQESETQSLQAGELAQQELAQTTAQNLQNRQRPESKPVPKTQPVQTAQAQALQAQEEYRRRQAEQARQANEQAIQSFGQTQSQSVQKQKQNYGRATTAVTDSKTKYPVRYKIVEVDELNTSHKIEGLGVVPNNDYRGIQPRDRERVGMQYDLLETAKNFDPDLALDQALSVNSGAPIVRNDNVVLNGNGRTIANRYAYENGNGDAYKNALIQNAQNFGLNADAISKMNRPILVREVVGDLGEKEMRDIAGATAGGSGMSSSEQAHSDATKISPNTIANFAQDEIDFSARELSDATKNLATSVLQNVATPAELNGYSDANGQIGQAGITRAKNAIAAYAYGKNDVLNRMSESTDDNIRNITAALANAAPDVAKVRAGMQNNSLHNYDLNFIADAAEKLSNLRNDDKKTASDYLNETTLGDTGLSTEAREVLSFLDKNKRSSQKISDFIKGIAKNIQEQGDPQQGSLFGESEPAPLIDLIKRARQEVESQEEKPAPKVEFAQEEKKPKRKSKGKWHTIGSAGSREDLQKYMQSHGMTVQITPDEKIITSDGKTLSDKIRVVKGRWQYGYYETDAKHSARGEVDTRIENFVDEKDLTPQQKLLKSFGEKLGVKTIFFRNEDGDFHGAHANGTTYINVNSKMPLGKVFWHESLHWLKHNDPKLYQRLVKAAGITDEQRYAYLEQSERTDLYTNAEIDEEIIADQFEDVAKRTGLLQNIAGKNRGLIQRVVQWLKDTMNKFIAHFRNPQGKFTTEQATRLADEFGKIAKDLVDPNGEKIFRYNNRTHNIELADGRNLTENETTDGNKELSPKNRVREILKPLRGKPITNKATGIVATIGRTGVEKMVSNRAVEKSVSNGYTEAQHLEAAANIKKLYEDATLTETKADKKNSPHLASIKRFHSNTTVDGEEASAKITVKENIFDGHKIYSIELEELSKPAGLQNRTGTDSPAGSEGSTQNNLGNATGVHYAEEPSKKSISQGEDEIKYSLGNSDNSSESLTQKIKNKMSAYFDDSRPSARRDKRIKDTLQKITGYRILFSHTNSDETIVDDFNKLIQAKHAYEWEKLLPQIGGKIAQRLKLNPNSEQSNYIADWLLTGALNNTSAEAKNFQKAMRENPEVAQLLQDVRNTFQEISDMSALERYKSKILHKEKKPLIQRLWGERKNLIEQWFDDLHPIKRMVRQMKETVSPEAAKMIDEMIDPYKMARLVRGKGALADLMIETDKEDIEKVRNAFREQYPFMKFDRLKSLAMIIEEAGGKQNLEDFEAFCVAKLDKEIYEKNRANPDGKQITPMDTEENADAAIKAGEKKFGTAQRSLVTYSNILLKMQFNAGLISQKQYSAIINGWKNYVPMARVFDENEDFDFSKSLERKVGSKRDTFSPIAKLICNTQEFIGQAERNKVKLELANIVHCGGFGEILADVENRNPDVKDIITYKENGQTKYLQVADITIKRAIDSMQTKSESTWLMKALHSTSRFMRACLTLANPDYAIGNIFRDMVDAFIHNKNLDANPFVAAMEVWRAGFREVVGKKKSQDYIDWLANGGSQSGFLTEDIDTAERSINKITGNTSRFRKVLDGFYQLAEVSEYATRLNTYKTSKAKLAAKRADGKATIEDKRNAALMSRDASIDFAKAGRSGRQLNRLLLFSNAALQALSLWGQKFSPAKLKTKEGRKEAASAVFRAVAMGIIPAILQAVLRNSDDDWKKKYKKAHDWEKDTYWIFGDVKVPKGVDLSIRLMSAFTDEVLDKMIDDDPVEFDRIKKAFIDAAPSLTATIFTPTIEAMANYSFFREAPIVPYSEQHLPKHLQYGSNTSTVAKLTGEIFGASPRKIDYLINGYFGFMGRTGSRIPDFLQRGITLDEVPMLRRFYFNPYKNPKIVKDFYEAYDEQEELLKGYKLERQKGEKVSLPEEYDARLHKRLKAAQETMRKLSKAQKTILDNPKLSFSERQEKIQALEKRRIALCEKVFRRAQ